MFHLLLSIPKIFIYWVNDEKQLVNVNVDFLNIHIYMSSIYPV